MNKEMATNMKKSTRKIFHRISSSILSPPPSRTLAWSLTIWSCSWNGLVFSASIRAFISASLTASAEWWVAADELVGACCNTAANGGGGGGANRSSSPNYYQHLRNYQRSLHHCQILLVKMFGDADVVSCVHPRHPSGWKSFPTRFD